jgi:hypothetical protein
MSPTTVAYALHATYQNGDFLGFVRIFREAEPTLPYGNIRKAWKNAFNAHKKHVLEKGFCPF